MEMSSELEAIMRRRRRQIEEEVPSDEENLTLQKVLATPPPPPPPRPPPSPYSSPRIPPLKARNASGFFAAVATAPAGIKAGSDAPASTGGVLAERDASYLKEDSLEKEEEEVSSSDEEEGAHSSDSEEETEVPPYEKEDSSSDEEEQLSDEAPKEEDNLSAAFGSSDAFGAFPSQPTTTTDPSLDLFPGDTPNFSADFQADSTASNFSSWGDADDAPAFGNANDGANSFGNANDAPAFGMDQGQGFADFKFDAFVAEEEEVYEPPPPYEPPPVFEPPPAYEPPSAYAEEDDEEDELYEPPPAYEPPAFEIALQPKRISSTTLTPILNPLTGNLITISPSLSLQEVNLSTSQTHISIPLFSSLSKKIASQYNASLLSIQKVVKIAAGVHQQQVSQKSTKRVRVAIILDLRILNQTSPLKVVAVYQWGYASVNHAENALAALQSVISLPEEAYDASTLNVADGILFLGGISGNKPSVYLAKPHVRDAWGVALVSSNFTKVSALAVSTHSSREYYVAVGLADGSISVWSYEAAVAVNKLEKEMKLLEPVCRLDGGALEVLEETLEDLIIVPWVYHPTPLPPLPQLPPHLSLHPNPNE
mmetsp:Transcript_23534/g.34219  ORF Transcript_23534/g.34219 Transcript_23534/m.34219 type:complete len:595 (+) Transcript_23534:276-2060(+)